MFASAFISAITSTVCINRIDKSYIYTMRILSHVALLPMVGAMGRYTHYFKSGCHPTCPDIRVQSIDDKCAEYISEAKAALSLDEFDFRFLLVLLASDWWLEGSRLCVRLI